MYIVGGYSKKQCWIEGALETCYDVFKMIKFKGIEISLSKKKKRKKQKKLLRKNILSRY